MSIILNASSPCVVESNIELIWENPNPTQAFPTSTVELTTGLYKYFYVSILSSTTGNIIGTSALIDTGASHQQAIVVHDKSGTYARGAIVESTGVRFTTGYYEQGGANEDKYAIPYRIYGVK